MHDPALPDQLIYRPAELIRLLGIPRTTLYRWVRQGDFPKPVKLGDRATGWHAADIEEWLASRPTAELAQAV